MILLTIHHREKLTEEINIRPNWFMGDKVPDMPHLGSSVFEGDDGHYYVYHDNRRFKFSSQDMAELYSNNKQKQFQKAIVEAHNRLSEAYQYSDKDKDVLARYTSILGDLNHRMTGRKSLNEDEEKMVNSLSKILEAHKTTEPMVVYSGINKAHHGILKNSEGPVEHRAFISTSINPNIARGFAEKSGGHIIELHVPVGTPSAYVSHVSEHDGERELILPRGMRISVDHSKRKTLIHDSGNFIVHQGTVG